MQPRTESDLEHALFGQWRALRGSGRFDNVLPRCTSWTRSSGRDGELIGYRTFDYRVHRQVRLAGAMADRREGIADIVETYWAIRTRGGVQDVRWPASLNVNVVELKTEPLRAQHALQVWRYRHTVAHSVANYLHHLRQQRAGAWTPDARSVYVRALLVGPSVHDSVMAVTRIIETYSEVGGAVMRASELPLVVARYVISALDGVTLERVQAYPEEEDSGELEPSRVAAYREIGARLVGPSHLLENGGMWTAPVDAESDA
jgi:hypothetical protein